MEREKLESMLIDYIDGNLSDTDKHIIEQEIGSSAETGKLYEQFKEVINATGQSSTLKPSDALTHSFNQLLTQELKSKPKGKSAVLVPMFYRIAAAVTILAVTGVAGYWIHKDQQYQRQLAVLMKKLEENKRAMMTMINNDQSASQRMMGVSEAYDMDKPDDEIVNVLIKTLNEDPNTNVRMAALDALGKFHDDPTIRKALIGSLKTQEDPVVQIALIQLMITMKEKTIIPQLEDITKDTRNIKAVKDIAYSGIMKLS